MQRTRRRGEGVRKWECEPGGAGSATCASAEASARCFPCALCGCRCVRHACGVEDGFQVMVCVVESGARWYDVGVWECMAEGLQQLQLQHVTPAHLCTCMHRSDAKTQRQARGMQQWRAGATSLAAQRRVLVRLVHTRGQRTIRGAWGAWRRVIQHQALVLRGQIRRRCSRFFAALPACLAAFCSDGSIVCVGRQLCHCTHRTHNMQVPGGAAEWSG